MSARIKMSRYMAGDPGMGRRMTRAMPGIGYTQGDPGLFSFIGKGLKAIGGVAKNIPGVGGLVGGGLGAVGGLLAGKRTAQRMGRPSVRPALPPLSFGPQGSGVPQAGFPATIARLLPGGSTGRTQHYTREEGPPGPGYHLNKSGYFLKDGTYIAPESVWVKNRRRNPLNPRALDRAIGRIESGKKAAGRLGRITVRKKCAHG